MTVFGKSTPRNSSLKSALSKVPRPYPFHTHVVCGYRPQGMTNGHGDIQRASLPAIYFGAEGLVVLGATHSARGRWWWAFTSESLCNTKAHAHIRQWDTPGRPQNTSVDLARSKKVPTTRPEANTTNAPTHL